MQDNKLSKDNEEFARKCEERFHEIETVEFYGIFKVISEIKKHENLSADHVVAITTFLNDHYKKMFQELFSHEQIKSINKQLGFNVLYRPHMHYENIDTKHCIYFSDLSNHYYIVVLEPINKI